jgi:hypothetical protein
MITLHKVSDTTRRFTFLMVDSTDHITGKTGLTPTVTRRKHGGSFALLSGSVAEIASGWYEITFASGDVDTPGELLIHVTGVAADPVDAKLQIISFDPYDATRFGLTALPNAGAGASGGLPTVDSTNAVKVQSGTGANQIDLSGGKVQLHADERAKLRGYALSGTTLTFPEGATATVVIQDGQITSITPD